MASRSRRRVLQGLGAAGLAAALPASAGRDAPREGEHRVIFSALAAGFERTWIGPDFWANRLADWTLVDGLLQCTQAGPAWPMRTLHLLTTELKPGEGWFRLTVRVESLGEGAPAADSAAGFLLAAGAGKMDYRAAALIHALPGPDAGWLAGIDGDGQPFLRPFGVRGAPRPQPGRLRGPVLLVLDAVAEGERTVLQLAASDARTGERIGLATLEVPTAACAGGLALVSHPGTGMRAARYGFQRWDLSGTKLRHDPERAFGPVLCTQYTVSRGVLKLAAQFPPLGPQDSHQVALEVRSGGRWEKAADAVIDGPSGVAAFRVPGWDAGRARDFRIACTLHAPGERPEPRYWRGSIRRSPTYAQPTVVASLSCVQQLEGNLGGNAEYDYARRVYFPHADLTPNLLRHDPDLWFFAGDQIYEGVPTRPIRGPGRDAELDYLYKWFLWCWVFGPVIRDAPCVTIPDDHDVNQGNVWGAGGVAARPGDPGGQQGGYGMPPAWVNLVQRTQTSHLPDPFDATPCQQGIGVYYTSLVWGGVGFAVLEDRKFKSSPALVQAEKTPDSHIIEKDFDPAKADVPGAQLLGARQLRFLREFALDWKDQHMKAVLSQTIFCNLQISSRGVTAGQLDKDLDSNGWPQSGRRAALEALRRGFMLHLAGDQHLASLVHHGLDDWEDAGWSLCSPAISNFYTRFWNPSYPPDDGPPGDQPFSGRYFDGFRNRMTVHAVANPTTNPAPGQFPEPVELHRKAPGYAIARFDKVRRTIRLEVWPRTADPRNPQSGGQYPGWPRTVAQQENYGRKPAAWLPELRVEGTRFPLFVVLAEPSGEVVYALRPGENRFQPWVFASGTYQVQVSDPERGVTVTLNGLEAGVEKETRGGRRVRLPG